MNCWSLSNDFACCLQFYKYVNCVLSLFTPWWTYEQPSWLLLNLLVDDIGNRQYLCLSFMMLSLVINLTNLTAFIKPKIVVEIVSLLWLNIARVKLMCCCTAFGITLTLNNYNVSSVTTLFLQFNVINVVLVIYALQPVFRNLFFNLLWLSNCVAECDELILILTL